MARHPKVNTKARVEVPQRIDVSGAAVPMLTPGSAMVLSHPDTVKDELLQFGFGANPLAQYRNEKNFFTRRRMCYEYGLRCTSLMGIVDSVSDEIASQEIYITPLETNPSATTILLAQRVVRLLNTAGHKADGIIDFIKNFTEGYWLSKTGAFILTPKDSAGQVESIQAINPMQPYPYYDFQTANYYGTPQMEPVIDPQYDTQGNKVHRIQGIWYTDGFPYGVNYFTLPIGQYHQVVPGATGWGAFLSSVPKAEHAMPVICAYTALIEYVLDTLLSTCSHGRNTDIRRHQ